MAKRNALSWKQLFFRFEQKFHEMSEHNFDWSRMDDADVLFCITDGTIVLTGETKC